MANEDGTIAWRELLAEATDRLAEAGHDNAAQQARWLVEEAGAFALEVSTSEVSGAALDELCTERGVARFDSMLARRLAGEPIQYVLGHWAFRTLDLMVDRRVLIPRPETEGLVEVALGELQRLRQLRPGPYRVADLGTGSGAIALSLAAEVDDVGVVAVEASRDALSVARANLAGLGNAARRVRIVEGSWFEPFGDHDKLDLVVSNPPYVADTDSLPAEVADWEPAGALLAGPQGFDDLDQIIGEAPRWLNSAGALVLEMDPRQIDRAIALAREVGFTSARSVKDLAGNRRVVVAAS